MKEKIHIMISGKVQGVFFRVSTRKMATKLAITGWVRNVADGKVEIEAEGERKQLEMLLDWCNQGPSHAGVTSVKSEWQKINDDHFSTFEIL